MAKKRNKKVESKSLEFDMNKIENIPTVLDDVPEQEPTPTPTAKVATKKKVAPKKKTPTKSKDDDTIKYEKPEKTGRPKEYSEPTKSLNLKLLRSMVDAIDVDRETNGQSRTFWIQDAIAAKLKKK